MRTSGQVSPLSAVGYRTDADNLQRLLLTLLATVTWVIFRTNQSFVQAIAIHTERGAVLSTRSLI